MNPIIQVEHFSKRYGDFTAVDNISFTVDEGSIFAFLGPNGAGKSTTINTLCTILDKTEGVLTINSHDSGGHQQRPGERRPHGGPHHFGHTARSGRGTGRTNAGGRLSVSFQLLAWKGREVT